MPYLDSLVWVPEPALSEKWEMIIMAIFFHKNNEFFLIG